MDRFPRTLTRPALALVALVGVGVVQWAIGSALDETREVYGWRWAQVGVALMAALAPILHLAIGVGASLIVVWVVRILMAPVAQTNSLSDGGARVVSHPTALREAPSERVFLAAGITSESVREPFKQVTAIQAAHLTEAYLGKWMRITAVLSDVTKFGQLVPHISVHLQDQSRLVLRFPLEYEERLSALQRGQTIHAIGKIVQVDEHNVTLANCELV